MHPVIKLRAQNRVVRYCHLKLQGYPPSRGLYSQTRPQGCLLDGPHRQQIPRTPLFQMEWQLMAFHLPPLWPVVSTLVIHQTALTSGRLPSSQGSSSYKLPRRYPPYIPKPGMCKAHVQWIFLPTTNIEFLGFKVDSMLVTFNLPSPKVHSIQKELCHALARSRILIRHLARVIGLLTASIQAIFPVPLHYWALQQLKNIHLHKGASYAVWIPLDSDSQDELRLWLQHMEAWNGRAIFGTLPDFTFNSDACSYGWGAHCKGFSTGVLWTLQERDLYISMLELLAGSFCSHEFLQGQS